jgi:uncharacterized protein YecT (DUF1311 family)
VPSGDGSRALDARPEHMQRAAEHPGHRRLHSGTTKFWDYRLNQAYKAATTSSQHPDMNSRVAPLQAGQREWVKYRDADCIGYHGSEQGTIRQIEVANCLLEMTQTRAIGRGAAIGSERDMLMRPLSVTP